jgi:hypothetical protein
MPLSSATPVCRRSIGGRDSGAIEKNKIGNERQLRSVYDDTEVKSVEKSSHTHTGHFALHRCDRFIANWIDWRRRRLPTASILSSTSNRNKRKIVHRRLSSDSNQICRHIRIIPHSHHPHAAKAQRNSNEQL